jgi:protein-S-isoprenylcysteine O-methyltransferase Ste14
MEGAGMSPELATIFAWSAFALSWFAAAFWSDPAAKRPAFGAEWLYRIVTVIGAVLLFGLYGPAYKGPGRLWALDTNVEWAFVGVAILGFALCWWARLYLGRLWSSSVTRKADHHVVDTGPYAIVRHPIYTGILLAAIATAAQKGTAFAVAGVIIWIIGFWIKARLEESFLREQLGADAYDSYRKRVPMLVPFGPR